MYGDVDGDVVGDVGRDVDGDTIRSDSGIIPLVTAMRRGSVALRIGD